MGQKTQKTSPDISAKSDRRRELRDAALIYGVPFAILVVLSAFVIPIFLPAYSGLDVLFIPLTAALIVALIGRIISVSNHRFVGQFVTSFVSGIVFFYLFLVLSDSLLGTVLGLGVAADFANFSLGILVFISGVLLYRFSSRVLASDLNYLYGVFTRRLSTPLILLSIGMTFAAYGPTAPIQFIFTYPALSSFILSFAPFLVHSKRPDLQDAGIYLLKTSSMWSFVAGLIGIGAAVLAIPKPPSLNFDLFVGLLIAVGIAIFYVGYKIYELSSWRIEAIRQSSYEKYKHELIANFHHDFDFLWNSTREFVSGGQAGHLMIALTILLTNAGIGYDECSKLLDPLVSYKPVSLYDYNIFELKKRVGADIQTRIAIVNGVFRSISQVNVAKV